MRHVARAAVFTALGAAFAAAAWPPVAAHGAQAVPADAPRARRALARVAVNPAQVQVGEPFTLTITVRAPAGTKVGFPVGPDSGVVEALASRRDAQQPVAGDSVEHVATYSLVAWDVGEPGIPFADVTLVRGAAVERVPLGRVVVAVRAVLPEKGDADPKPAKALLDLPRSRWLEWLAIALVLTALALLLWARRRGAPPAPAPEARGTVPDPLAALAALERLQLDAAGEPARVLVAAADAVRAAMLDAEPRTRTLTTEELARRPLPGLPLSRILPLLESADVARYGRQPVSAARARAAIAEARIIVGLLRGHGTSAAAAAPSGRRRAGAEAS